MLVTSTTRSYFALKANRCNNSSYNSKRLTVLVCCNLDHINNIFLIIHIIKNTY